MLAVANIAAEDTRATFPQDGILACQTGLILAGAEPTFRLLRWLALRGSPPGSLERPVIDYGVPCSRNALICASSLNGVAFDGEGRSKSEMGVRSASISANA